MMKPKTLRGLDRFDAFVAARLRIWWESSLTRSLALETAELENCDAIEVRPYELAVVPRDGDIERVRNGLLSVLISCSHRIFPSHRAVLDDLGARISAVRTRHGLPEWRRPPGWPYSKRPTISAVAAHSMSAEEVARIRRQLEQHTAWAHT